MRRTDKARSDSNAMRSSQLCSYQKTLWPNSEYGPLRQMDYFPPNTRYSSIKTFTLIVLCIDRKSVDKRSTKTTNAKSILFLVILKISRI